MSLTAYISIAEQESSLPKSLSSEHLFKLNEAGTAKPEGLPMHRAPQALFNLSEEEQEQPQGPLASKLFKVGSFGERLAGSFLSALVPGS